MTKREARHIRRELTPQEQDRVAEARRLVESEKDEIRHRAKVYKAQHDAASALLKEAFSVEG